MNTVLQSDREFFHLYSPIVRLVIFLLIFDKLLAEAISFKYLVSANALSETISLWVDRARNTKIVFDGLAY